MADEQWLKEAKEKIESDEIKFNTVLKKLMCCMEQNNRKGAVEQ